MNVRTIPPTHAEAAAEQPAERPAPTSVHAEVTAMGIAYDALAKLDAPAGLRALRWLDERLHADYRSANASEEPPF